MATKITFDDFKRAKGLTTEEAPDMGATFNQTDSMLESAGPRKINFAEFQRAKGMIEEDESPFEMPEGTLRKDDLKAGPNADKIREYMIQRFGVDYNRDAGKDNDTVVEEFVDHMRWMNSNVVSVAGEARYITNADEGKKDVAGTAYALYDRLGNMFTNDGFTGAVDGIKDYLFSAAADPSNYIGILTGGIGKAAGVGITQGGKMAVKRAAVEAGRQAIAKGATQEAAKAAGQAAAKRAAQRFAAANIGTAQSKAVRAAAARAERDIFLREAKKRAQRAAVGEFAKGDAKKILMATTASDAAFSMMHDVTLQNTLIEAGAQEQYSAVQTGFSSLLGGVAGLAQLGFGKFKGSSGLSEADIKLKFGAERSEELAKVDAAVENIAKKTKRVPIETTEELAQKAAADIRKKAKDFLARSDSWEAKVKRGEANYYNAPTPVEMFKDIMVGEDGKSGLVKLYKDNGMAIPKGATVSDVMTSLVTKLPQNELDEINKAFKPFGITLGDTTEIAQNLGDYLAVEISKGGKVLNVMSQVRKSVDAAVVYGNEIVENQVRAIDNLEEEAAKATKMKGFEYGQNVWRRLLVSSPATTAVNVMGFGQFYVGQSLADVFSSTGHTLYGLARGGSRTKAGREALRVGKIYRSIQAQKMRNLLDPHTTHDAYMSFLSQHKDVGKVLFESFTGGVQRSAGRYGIDPDANWFKRTEMIVDGANRVTGVRIQDTFTKSQMFMTELDKWVRINHDRTLADVLEKGDLNLIDNDAIGASLDTTLKSVFSKDYTTDDQLLANAAQQVEKFSNIPVIGTILPFGRFFNNTIATAYQWSVGGGVQMASAMYNKAIKGAPVPKTATEAFSRSLVGVTSLRLAMEYDEQRRDQGLGTFEIDAGGGNIIDAKNMFPFSLWLAVGRAGNLARQGEEVPKELIEDVTAQLAIGQFASDIQFGNDLYNVFDTLFSGEPGARQASLDAVYKQGGNILAGFTRPIDAVNRMVGLINNSDAARDVRQEKGINVGIMGATKYVDNIIEIFTDKLDSVTGEELRVATREGSLRDVNPVLRVMGIKQVPARTSTDKAYSMAEMHPWKANERSQIPAYDKVFNTMVAPLLEERYADLVDSPKFKDASVAERRVMLNSWKRIVTKELRDYLAESPEAPQSLLAAQRKATIIGNKDLRHEAMRDMREQFGYKGSGPREMNWQELQLFTELVDYYKEINEVQ
jgi:hypothetical protein